MRQFLLIISFLIIIISCKKDDPFTIGYDDIPLEDEIQLDSELKVKVDPRIELLAVVQHFTAWADERHTKFGGRYKDQVDKYFSKFSDHNAINISENLTNSGFAFDAPPAFVLYHGDLPEFEQIHPYSDYLIGRAGSAQKLEEFANELRNFAEETDFLYFMETQKPLFRRVENDIKRTISNNDYIEIIEEYYGIEQNSYNVIPALLFHAGGYGPKVTTENGNDIYNICGPQSSNSGIPNFGNLYYFQYILLHEFSHSFVNPLNEQNRQEIDTYIELFEPIRVQMEESAYSTWETCLNEYLVRVNVARFFNDLEGSDSKNEILSEEYDIGFIYIYGLDSLMQIYESDRATYPSYDLFYSEILNYLESLTQ